KLGRRERLLNHGPASLLAEGLANYLTDPVFRALAPTADSDRRAAMLAWETIFSNTRLTWNDLSLLCQRTRLPIVAKGILHAGDAEAALDSGVNGLIVSNHGGRQLDGAIASLDALPKIVRTVAGKIPVLF